jgi:hypothetical protein
VRLLLLLCLATFGSTRLPAEEAPSPPPASASVPVPAPVRVLVHRVDYTATLTEGEARIRAGYDVELLDRGEASISLLEGDVAVPAASLPSGLRLQGEGAGYRLVLSETGRKRFTLEFLSRVTRTDVWHETSFVGPALAAISTVSASAPGRDVELTLLSGAVSAAGVRDDVSFVEGALGDERRVALRWCDRNTAITRQTLLACETIATTHITPAVITCTTVLALEVVQGALLRLEVSLPAGQSLTRLQGEQLRDWQVTPGADGSRLAIEFIAPIERAIRLTLQTEQPLEGSPIPVAWSVPQPLGVERESGQLTFTAEDMNVEVEGVTELRQVEAVGGALYAYRFHARPCRADLRLRRIDPLVMAEDRISLRLEDTRLLVTHDLDVGVERAGLYTLELAPLGALNVNDVRADGLEGWKVADGRLHLSFARRLLGRTAVAIELEQSIADISNAVNLVALRVTGAARESARIGAGAVPGIRLRTRELAGLRETPVSELVKRGDAVLAFVAEQPDWALALTADHMQPRVLAEVFNLIAVGDGLVGGSATIRYAILNQGVQELNVAVPAHWKNVDFVGPNIRRKEQQDNRWAISLQEKAWGGYTLVVTYDFAFDPQQATLPLGGLHVGGVERETGAIAVSSVPSLQLREQTATAVTPAQFFRIDEAELAAADRALVSHAVLLAYRYSGDGYDLRVNVTRFKPVDVLEAVADLTQLSTVLTQDGQLLTQAAFMIKNNEKQFQRFQLPEGAEFWGCYADGQPVKPGRDGEAILVPLPRGANRDDAHPVEIVYAEKAGDLRALWPRRLALNAPRSDIQTTFAQWTLYVPPTHRLARFSGNMTPARGTSYGLRDAWNQFTRFYDRAYLEFRGLAIGLAVLAGFVVFIVLAVRRRWRGVVAVLSIAFVVVILGAMLLPAVSKARLSARRIAHQQADMAMPTDSYAPMPSAPASQAVGGERGSQLGAMEPMEEEALDSIAVDAEGQSGDTSGLAAKKPGATTATTVAGVQSLRIELPKTGTAYTFTKVLDLRSEALTVAAWAAKETALKAAQGAVMLAVFLLGWLIVWRERRRECPGRLRVAAGLFLVLVSTTALLLVTRLLGAAMVVAAPVGGVALLVSLIRYRRARRRAAAAPAGAAAAAVLALLLAGAGTAQAGGVVAISSATYTGMVTGNVARVEAVLVCKALALDETNGLAEAALFGAGAAVAEFHSDSRRAVLVRDGGGTAIRFSRRGTATVRATLIIPVGGGVARRTLAVAVPGALSSRLDLTIPEPEANVEAPAAVSHHVTPLGEGRTRVEVLWGPSERLELAWLPRVKRAAEAAAMVFADTHSLVHFGGGIMSVRATLHYQVTQGERRELRIAVPAGQRVLRAEGDGLGSWDVQDVAGTNILVATMAQGVSEACTLVIDTEAALAPLPTTVRVDLPQARDVVRESGLVALLAADELDVAVTRAEAIQKVDPEEFPRAASAGKALRDGSNAVAHVLAAYRFAKPGFALEVGLQGVQAEIEAQVINHLYVAHECVDVAARVDYLIKRSGVFMLRLGVPADYEVTAVTGEHVAQWSEKTEEGQRVLLVQLRDRVSGACRLRVNLYRWLPGGAGELVAVGVDPLDATTWTGLIKVGSALGLQTKATSLSGLNEVPATSVENVGSGGGALAYKFRRDRAAGDATPWSLTLAAESVDPWVRAEVVHEFRLDPAEMGLVEGRTRIRYDIQNAPVKEFRLRVPAVYRNVDISGPNIRRRDQEGDTWRVELQSRTAGSVTLNVAWDRELDVGQPLDLTGITTLATERETGAVLLFAPAPLQVAEASTAGDVVRTDERDLPAWYGARGESAALIWRYLRPGWALTAGVQRYRDAEVLNVLIDRADFATVVAEDGQVMTEVKLTVRNTARQYLELALPVEATLWSAFVDGEAVRPSLRGDRLLVPLVSGVARGEENRVNLMYVSGTRFPPRRGIVALETPAFDAPVKNASWELYLPPDYAYARFGGSMLHTPPDLHARNRVLLFSMSEYVAEEAQKKSARSAAASAKLEGAKQKLALNDLKDANVAYQQVRQGGWAADKEDLAQLASDLRRAQASNVIESQRQFVEKNAVGRDAGQLAAALMQGATAQQTQEREEAAARQYERLQQAQELVVATVRPLHVNLPRRGVRYAFVQPLQTETGKPMTVHFRAVNASGVSLPLGIGVGAATFAGLWLLVALMQRRRGTSAL